MQPQVDSRKLYRQGVGQGEESEFEANEKNGDRQAREQNRSLAREPGGAGERS